MPLILCHSIPGDPHLISNRARIIGLTKVFTGTYFKYYMYQIKKMLIQALHNFPTLEFITKRTHTHKYMHSVAKKMERKSAITCLLACVLDIFTNRQVRQTLSPFF